MIRGLTRLGAIGVVLAMAFAVVATPDMVRANGDIKKGSIKDARPSNGARWGGAPGSWHGGYAGVHIGGGYGTSRNDFANGNSSGDFDIDGYLFGATLGYNWNYRPNVVVGIETDVSLSDIEGVTANGCCATAIDWLWTIRGRLGYDFNGIMPYITAGIAVADIDAATVGGASVNETTAGAAVGAGIEMRISPRMTLKGEYLFVDFETVDIPGSGGTVVSVDDLSIFRVGMNYRF